MFRDQAKTCLLYLLQTLLSNTALLFSLSCQSLTDVQHDRSLFTDVTVSHVTKVTKVTSVGLSRLGPDVLQSNT